MLYTWTAGDVSGSTTLTDEDHLYPSHINEIRTNVNDLKGDFDDLDAEVGYLGFYNVKNHGVKGDGTTNDATAINSLISSLTSGGVVYFPPTTSSYLISSPILITRSNITLLGLDAKNTKIQLKAGSNCNMVDITGNNPQIRGLKFDGDASNQTTGWGIVTYTATSVGNGVIANCEFTDIYHHCITLSNSYNFRIENNFIYDTSGDGIQIYTASTRIIVTNNLIKSVGDVGIIALDSEKITIANNQVTLSKSDGIAFYGVNFGVIENNISHSNETDNTFGGKAAIRIADSLVDSSGTTNSIISGNICFDEQSPKKQEYGIYEETNGNLNIYTNNCARAILQATGGIVTSGLNNVVANNIT